MDEKKIAGKAVLLIAPLFFNYYREMMKELELLGANVDYICDAPSNSNISKALGRINKSFIRGATVKYFKNDVLPKILTKKYDYILVVGGMTFAFTPDMMSEIKELQQKTVFILYQWDSEKNLPYAKDIHKFFDRRYSFDRYDCKRDVEYRFLPLFYTRTYEIVPSLKEDEIKYDCSYIGTAHPKKYKGINEMAEAMREYMPRQFIYHYMPSKLKYIYHKITATEFRYAKISDFQTEKLLADKTMEIFTESKCILDAPQKGQTGLTIRTIECLGARRKMITINEDIKYYDFYRPENILIYSGKIDPEDKFFKTPYVDISEDIYRKYSLKSWLEALLC